MFNYPICKSCSFLGINYYEEISNTFEDCLSEALIPETVFISNENCEILKVDESYRCLWKEALPDEKFLNNEANKVEESLKNITKNAVEITNDFKWNSQYYKNIKSCNKLEEETFNEKDLSELRGKVLHAQFQLLDVPQLAFPLTNLKPSSSTKQNLTTLLKILPKMEVDDSFNFEDGTFEDNDMFFNVDTNDEKINYSPDDNSEFKELILPELSTPEINNLEEVLSDLQCAREDKDLANENGRKDNSYMQPNSFFPQSNDTISKTNNDSYNNCQTLGILKINSSNISYERGSHLKWDLEEINLEENSLFKNVMTESRMSIDKVVVENCAMKENRLSSTSLSNPIQDKSQGFSKMPYINYSQKGTSKNIVSNLSLNSDTFLEDTSIAKIICNTNENSNVQFENEVDSCSFYQERNTTDDLNFLSKPFNEAKQGEKVYLLPIETLTSFEFSENSCDEEQMKFEKPLPELESHITDPYKEKLSNLQYRANLSLKRAFKSETAKIKSTNFQNIKNYTMLRKEISSQSSSHYPGKARDIALQNGLNSQPMDLLSNFLQIQYPFQNSQAPIKRTESPLLKSTQNSKIVLENLVHRPNVIDSEFNEKNVAPSNSSQHFKDECIPLKVQLEVEDLYVELPGEYVTLLLHLESSAIPLLQILMLSERFKFPSNITLADIPPYKTCFLLNQEVKRCADMQVNKANMGDFYTHLLILHGILKTMECFIHFDIHLALLCLQEFDTAHKILIKGYYEKLIENLEQGVDECFENISIHPKIKELSTYLSEKFKFCKEHQLKFKVLVILKKNLEAVYTNFEKVLKTEFGNFQIYQIPESVFLHPNTLIFKSKDDIVYFTNASSLSKDIPLSDLSLIIEFEHDNQSNWEQICLEQNIAHAFVKVAKLPLKTLEEIQTLKVSEKKFPDSEVENIKLLIVSASITPQYQLLYLLESKFQFSICIRSYKEFLPHLYFADIVVDAKSALILVSDASFASDDFHEILSDRISFLHIKFEMCWIIVQKYLDKKNLERSSSMKSNNNFLRFCSLMVNFNHKVQTYKLKILITHNVEETADVVKDIFNVSSRNKGCESNISIPSQITKEEIFLSSFPSLNPFVINLMLTKCSLYELLNLTVDVMCKKFPSIPDRFLHCFYSTNHKVYTSPSPGTHEEISEFPKNSSHESSSDHDPDFELKPSFQIALSTQSSNYSNTNNNKNKQLYDRKISQKFWNNLHCDYEEDEATSQEEKSLQELDIDYMSLKICNKYDESQSSIEEDVFQSSDEIPKLNTSRHMSIEGQRQRNKSTSFSFETLSSQISNESRLSFDSNADLEENIDNTYKHMLKAGAISNYTTKTYDSDIDHEFSDTQNNTRPLLNFNQFKYAPNKRKLSEVDGSSQQFQLPKKPCKAPKGMTSKTVSKQDLIYKSPFDSQELLPSSLPNRKEAKVLPFMIRKHGEYKPSDCGRVSNVKRRVNSFENYPLSQWSDTQSIRSIPLTPRLNRRLGFEKMPGNEGQTRLVFH